MFEWILLLFVLGALSIFLEALVPGGLLGIAGGICLLIAIVLSFVGFGMEAGFLSIVIAFAVVAATLYLEFKLLPKTAFGRRFFLMGRNDATSNPAAPAMAALVGKTGLTVTPMRPSGVVVIDGERHEASSASGYIEKNIPVRVTAHGAFKITVIPINS